MLLSFDDDHIEELISYNELEVCDIVAEQHDAEANGEQDIFAFREILDHRYVKPHNHDYKGSSINVLVAWEDGTETWQPLTLMAKSDPVILAVYAKEHDLLDQPGWKCFRKIARRAKVLKRMVNASKRKQNYNAIHYKFGVRIPQNIKEAKMLDKQNGNTYWQDAIDLELAQIKEYKVL
jgi:hypothetical protein